MDSTTTATVRRKVPGDALREYDDDFKQIEAYTQMCLQQKYMDIVEDIFEVDLVKSDEEVNQRKKIIEGYRKKSGFPENTIEMGEAYLTYNSWHFGHQLSNLLTGYLIAHKVKIPQIDHKVYTGTGIFGFQFYKVNSDYLHFDQKSTNARLKAFELAIIQWLDQSELRRFLTGDSVEQWGAREQNSELLVVRRSMIVDFHFTGKVRGEGEGLDENGRPKLKIKGHTMLFFWHAVKTKGDDLIEHGLADNLYDHKNESYGFSKKLNADFYNLFNAVFKKYCRRYIGELADEMEMVGLQNNIPCAVYETKKNKKIDFTCFTINRRMLIYFSLMYNVRNVNMLVEYVREEDDVSPIFLVHMSLYLHHMDRMMYWLLNSALIWPKKGQTEPNKWRPCCIVRSCRPFELEYMADIVKKYGEKTRLCVELNEETACLDLFDPVRERILKCWFKWDGERAFSSKESFDERCLVQAVMDTLTERVRALEARALPGRLLAL